MRNNVSRHITARPRGFTPTHTKARSNRADISRQILLRHRHIPLHSKGDCGLLVSAGFGSRLGAFKVKKAITSHFASIPCPMQTQRNTASSKRRARRRKSPMCRRHTRSPAMTIATFLFERDVFHVAAPLMFYLPRSFQPEESPALIEARIRARQWMRDRGIGRSLDIQHFVVAMQGNHKLTSCYNVESHTENME